MASAARCAPVVARVTETHAQDHAGATSRAGRGSIRRYSLKSPQAFHVARVSPSTRPGEQRARGHPTQRAPSHPTAEKTSPFGALGPYAAPSLVPVRVGVRAKPRGMAGKDRGRAERAPEIRAETELAEEVIRKPGGTFSIGQILFETALHTDLRPSEWRSFSALRERPGRPHAPRPERGRCLF
jgi:hypothetical protein